MGPRWICGEVMWGFRVVGRMVRRMRGAPHRPDPAGTRHLGWPGGLPRSRTRPMRVAPSRVTDARRVSASR
ncbi:hypothetical protein ACFSM7_12305 [Clavibacter michiganensis subsp. tessellarius]|uniref:hypothetical protein n=1 Tax=Clavibacter tessellarius TaxID=31965 RepID=UPI0036328142